MYEYDLSGRIPLYRQEAPTMTTIEQEDALYALYDAVRLDQVPDGTVVRFDAPRGTETPIRASDHVVTYAALAISTVDGPRWFMTGRCSLNGGSTEDFVAWLIVRGVTPSALVALR